MSFPFTSGYATWPSLEFRLQEWVEALSERRSMIIALPAGIAGESLWSLLDVRLESRSLDPVGLYLPELMAVKHSAGSVRLEQRVAQALDIEWEPENCPRTMENLVRQQLPPVIGLLGLEELEAGQQAEWLSFLQQWSAAAHSAANSGELFSACCLLLNMAELDRAATLPGSSLYLDVSHWWGIPTALEAHLYCRSEVTAYREPALALWGEYILPSLTGADVSLMHDVLPLTAHENIGPLVQFFAAEGRRRGWDAGQAQVVAAGAFSAQARIVRHEFTTLSPAAQQWWAQGMLYFTTEYGVELHTALLALAGHHDAIQHRLWRGQAALLLPVLDQVRLTLCSYLTARYDSTWPVRWGSPATPEEKVAVHETPLATQWGHLEYLLSNVGALRAERQYSSLAHRARRLRNHLAHYKPVTFIDFQRLLQDLASEEWRDVLAGLETRI